MVAVAYWLLIGQLSRNPRNKISRFHQFATHKQLISNSAEFEKMNWIAHTRWLHYFLKSGNHHCYEKIRFGHHSKQDPTSDANLGDLTSHRHAFDKAWVELYSIPFFLFFFFSLFFFPPKTENSNLHGLELHRPSIKSTKLLFYMIQAIIIIMMIASMIYDVIFSDVVLRS